MRTPEMFCLLLAAAGVAPAVAQESAAPQSRLGEDLVVPLGTTVTEEAQAVLDRMSATLDGLRSFKLSTQSSRDEVLPYGYKLQNSESTVIWIERPNRLRVEVDGDIKLRTYVFDGKQLTIASPEDDIYAVTDHPGTIGELVMALMEAEVEVPLIDLLYHGSVGGLTENVRAGLRVGDSEVDGIAVDHLAFRQPDVDWQLWVQKGAQALPLKLLITTRYAVADPQYEVVMTWDTRARPGKDAFVFIPDDDDTKVAFSGALAPAPAGGAR